MEIFLAKVVGLYFLIIGVLVVVRQRAIMPAMADIAKNRGLIVAIACIELAAGLSLVVAYPSVSLTLPGILSLVGYMMVAESIVYFAFPVKAMKKMMAMFNKPSWYAGGGVASILIGAYLVAVAFGYWA